VAPLLPKLRGHFAEFLNHSSLERLGILYLTTCVGFGYGPQQHSLEAFLGSMGSPYFASIGYASPLTHPIKGDTRIYLGIGPRACTRTTTAWRDYPPASPHHLPTTGSGPTLPPQPTPKDRPEVRMVSITGPGTDALSRAREYQPVIHRLRLSASP
jgi:hypothetical protein